MVATLVLSTVTEIVYLSRSVEVGSPSSIVRMSGSSPSGIENSSVFGGMFSLLNIWGKSVSHDSDIVHRI